MQLDLAIIWQWTVRSLNNNMLERSSAKSFMEFDVKTFLVYNMNNRNQACKKNANSPQSIQQVCENGDKEVRHKLLVLLFSSRRAGIIRQYEGETIRMK